MTNALTAAQLTVLAREHPLSRLTLSVAKRGDLEIAELSIDGVPLISRVDAIELPFAQAEVVERNAAEHDLPPLRADELARRYVSLRLDEVALPSRALFGAREGSRLEFADSDPRSEKTVLLICDCGFAECGSLLATVTVLEDRVIWSDFEHNHRPWVYDLVFVFEREAYERALTP
jgi:hypothetical protein